nr:immunoglobulin light chain junction region [Macaca mulatta]MOX36611.1 immunoglobulin light chain junction region [Macaca mulatta]
DYYCALYMGNGISFF